MRTSGPPASGSAATPDGIAAQLSFVGFPAPSAQGLFTWWGSKRHQAAGIAAAVACAWTDGPGSVYWEPFAGAAHVFFAVGPRQAELSDINPDVCSVHAAVKHRPADVLSALRRHEASHGREHFEASRPRPGDTAERAAWMIYMTYCSHAGRYQVNRDEAWAAGWHPGLDNGQRAPWRVSPRFVARLQAAHRALESSDVRCRDWTAIEPGQGDMVYADPPYDGAYRPYAPGSQSAKFGASEQTALAEACMGWRRNGAAVAVSSSDTAFMRGLYSADDWEIEHMPAVRRAAAGHPTSHGSAPTGYAGSDLLFLGHPLSAAKP